MEKNIKLPLIPLRGMTIFPGMVIHFDVGREKSKNAVEAAMINEEDIFLASQIDDEVDEPCDKDIYEIGTVCKVKQLIKLPGDILRVLVEGKERGRITLFENNEEYLQVEIEELEEEIEETESLEAKVKLLKAAFRRYLKLTGEASPELIRSIKKEEINSFADMVGAIVTEKDEDKQEILETLNVEERIEKILKITNKEIEIIKLQKKISNKVKANMDKSQKEYYLREQIRVIREELGEDEEKEILNYEKKINDKRIPKNVKEKLNTELNKLRNSGVSSTEGNNIKTYLDWVLSLPWNKNKKDRLDILEVEKKLNSEHYGLDNVKERIVEYLAVQKVTKNTNGQILCLVGPPGVGKSSIVKSIADSLNRDYARISLGGMRDEAEIRGHRRTYVGAIPGRIVYALKEAKTSNPVILLDEIDKLNSDYKGDPADALLEVLDKEQNSEFRDNYIEVPIDLSKVLFITTANSLDTIPRPLLDRMDVIQVSGYTPNEKLRIAKDYLVPKIAKELSLDKIKISDSVIKEIIEGYTKEAGVRSLERTIKRLLTKALAKNLKENRDSVVINTKNMEKLLGKKIFTYERIDKEDKIGVVTGLAWTAYGGDTLPVEVMVMKGTGKLELTGQLGDVMKESAKAAYTFTRANALQFGIEEEFYKNTDIHIHVPEGAVPKDGPSAGVTMTTALVSALSKRKVRNNIAMTGEVTLTGRVLPIGGLKEKSFAAVRAGVDTIIIPKENERDLEKIPVEIKSKLNIISVKHVTEVIDNALLGEE